MARIFVFIISINFMILVNYVHLSRAWVNCTDNCLENFRRKWPKLDFEFYYDQNNLVNIGNNDSSSSFAYSTRTNNATKDNTTSKTYLEPIFHILMNNNDSLTGILAATLSNCSNDYRNLVNSSSSGSTLSFPELQLLKTSFQNEKLFNSTRENLTEYFHDKLIKVYEYGYHNQRNELAQNDSLELKILGIVFNDSRETIDIIYNLRDNNGTLIKWQEASQFMNSLPNDLLQNLTGFPVIIKVEPYIVATPSQSQSDSNWINLATLWTVLGISLLLFLVFILCLYCFCKRDRQYWLEDINREISRVQSISEQDVNDYGNHGQWNSASSSVDDLSSSYSTSQVKKLDKSSQYDYATLSTGHPIRSWQTFTTKMSSSSNNKERLIPIQGIKKANSDTDYDKISYIHSRETIRETHKHPNIFEIKLREETQSIVKEIRKELDRYHQRKISLNDDSSTSEA